MENLRSHRVMCVDQSDTHLEPWLSICRALSSSVEPSVEPLSVGPLSILCRLTIVDLLSTLSVEAILTGTRCTSCRSICRCSVDLSICRSVDLSICRSARPTGVRQGLERYSACSKWVLWVDFGVTFQAESQPVMSNDLIQT